MARNPRMEANRNMKIDTLKARIDRSDYEVDAEAVAAAIVRRLAAARAGATAFSPSAPTPPAGVPDPRR